jgi:dipeptidyl-peptidase 4
MKKTGLILVALLTLTAASANLLYEITDGKFRASTADAHPSMNDGEHYSQLADDQTIVKVSYKTGQVVDTLFSLRKVRNAIIKSISGYQMSPRETRILVWNNVKPIYRRSFTAEYYIYDIRQRELDPLSQFKPQQAPVFSPDDRYLAFAHGNNLHMKKADFKSEIQITKDGEAGKIINGIADWLYEEEFSGVRYYDWSPDSKLLAFVKFDESQVKSFTFQRFLNSKDRSPLLYPELTTFKYPKAGEANPKVSVHVYDDFNKKTIAMNLNERETDFYVPRIKWTSSADQLAVFVMNRIQNRMDMLFANPRSGISRLIQRLESKQYVDYENIDFYHFSADNTTFYGINENDGFRHIYEYQMNGTPIRQITKGNWEVTDFYGIDEARKLVYYQSNEASPLQKDVYVINARGVKTKLSTLSGISRAVFSKNFSYYILDESNLRTPNEISVRNNRGVKVRDVKSNAQLSEKLNSYQLNQKEFFSFNTPDNIQLNGWMLKPKAFDPQKKYPVLMVQYSGPGSQLVLDQWSVGWEYYLAEQGYVVACVDGRGTGGRGTAFRNSTYLQMGIPETADQVATARYLGSQSYIDAKRIGIFGWSYGGSMTLWAMSTGEQVFKAGISVAPVTDWRFYDTAYTERFMQTPEQNAGGYALTSAVEQASKLKGRLLLVHGTADDNVHYSNALVYADKLVEAGIQFDMHIYTDKNHSITGRQTRRHLYTKFVDFLKSNL